MKSSKKVIRLPIKVLLLNMSSEIKFSNEKVVVFHSNLENRVVLHDFHVILMDMNELLDAKYWHTKNGLLTTGYQSRSHLAKDIEKQLLTGGIIFCFSGEKKFAQCYNYFDASVFTGSDGKTAWLSNSFFLPNDLDIINEGGDTFYPRLEELGYFSQLIKQIPKEDIKWKCYFSKIPKNTRVFAINRASHPIFIEITIGPGKLIMLPYFVNKDEVINEIITKIIPQIFPEDEFYCEPIWIKSIKIPLEVRAQNTLYGIQKSKQLISTKDKLLKKSVTFALEKIGFSVREIPDETNEDIEIMLDGKMGKVEVKGHEMEQAGREDVTQLLNYLPEDKADVKGIVIANHEFNKPPSERSTEAFTIGAIELAEKASISLISTLDLQKVTLAVLEERIANEELMKIRDQIMIGKGIVHIGI